MASVRESLNIVGQSASIKQLAEQRNESFPLSLRNFIGAPPPGRILRKVISLDFCSASSMCFSINAYVRCSRSA
jgi:hypothetical protein